MELKKLIVSNKETIEEVAFTSDETAEWEALNSKAAEERAARLAEQAAKEAARETALGKLKALGLTEAEIAAITGA